MATQHQRPPGPSLLLLSVVLVSSLSQHGVWGMEDVRVDWVKDKWYNPSLVEYKDNYVAAVKSTDFKRTNGKTW